PGGCAREPALRMGGVHLEAADERRMRYRDLRRGRADDRKEESRERRLRERGPSERKHRGEGSGAVRGSALNGRTVARRPSTAGSPTRSPWRPLDPAGHLPLLAFAG